MDLRDYIDVLRARWKLIVACTLLGLIAAAAVSMLTTPQYTSTTKVLVNAADAQSNVGTAYTGSLYTQQIVKSLVDVVSSERVTQAVVDQLNLDSTPAQVGAQISASNPLDTALIEISVTDPNPETAQQIAAAAAQQFAQAAQEYTQPGGTGTSLVTVSVIEAANLPGSPSSPRTTINLALGLLVGLAVGVGAAVLLETLDTRIKSVDGLQKYFDQPVLAVIGYDPDAKKMPLLTQIAPQSKRSESFRQLRTNLQFVDVDNRPRSVVVTSSIEDEGKSTTAVNLAITIAQTGQPVILVEGDLRRPRMAEYLGVEGNAGLTDVLIGRASVEDVLQPWGPTGSLWVLPSGPLPPNPAELVGSLAMSELVTELEQRAFVIIDVPPLLPATDGAVLTKFAGGSLLVVSANKVRREQLRTAEENITNVGGRILGLVFNMASKKGPDSHRYGYSYSYEEKGKGKGASRTTLSVEDAAIPLARATAGAAVIGAVPRNGATILPGGTASAANGANGTSNGTDAVVKQPPVAPPAVPTPAKPEVIASPAAADEAPAVKLLPASSDAVARAGAAAPSPERSESDAAFRRPQVPTPDAPSRETSAPVPTPVPTASATPVASAPERPVQETPLGTPAPVAAARPQAKPAAAVAGSAAMAATAGSAATAATTTAPGLEVRHTPSTPGAAGAAAPVAPTLPPVPTVTSAPPATPAPPSPAVAAPPVAPGPDQASVGTPQESGVSASRLEELLGTYHLESPAEHVPAAEEVPVDWTPPAPKPAFDPLTAPLDQLPGWNNP